MKLIEKLFEIQKAVSYLRKDNQGYQYQYVSSSQTLGTIRAKMDEMKVMLIPRVTGRKVERSESENDRGKLSVQFFTEIDVAFDWINVEAPEEVISCPWYSQGKDSGEKGVGKAFTYGEKYFLLKFFHIATDKDDPDAFQERRVEAGKRRRVTGGAPPPPSDAPPPEEPPPDRLVNGNAVPGNPWFGYLDSITKPVTGETGGRKWTKWEISTPQMNLLCFDTGVAEVAMNAIQDGVPVELIWKLKRSKRTNTEACLAEAVRILDADEIAKHFGKAA